MRLYVALLIFFANNFQKEFWRMSKRCVPQKIIESTGENVTDQKSPLFKTGNENMGSKIVWDLKGLRQQPKKDYFSLLIQLQQSP